MANNLTTNVRLLIESGIVKNSKGKITAEMLNSILLQMCGGIDLAATLPVATTSNSDGGSSSGTAAGLKYYFYDRNGGAHMSPNTSTEEDTITCGISKLLFLDADTLYITDLGDYYGKLTKTSLTSASFALSPSNSATISDINAAIYKGTLHSPNYSSTELSFLCISFEDYFRLILKCVEGIEVSSVSEYFELALAYTAPTASDTIKTIAKQSAAYLDIICKDCYMLFCYTNIYGENAMYPESSIAEFISDTMQISFFKGSEYLAHTGTCGIFNIF